MVEKIKVWLKEHVDSRDIIISISLLMVGVGCWLIYPPAALIAMGIGLFGLGTGMIKIYDNIK